MYFYKYMFACIYFANYQGKKRNRASNLTMSHSFSVHVALRKKVNEFVDSSRRQSLPRNTQALVALRF